ncbi:MAG: ribonuclease H-like domain-containing protein [Candidatus Pacearchaeota archaeon]
MIRKGYEKRYNLLKDYIKQYPKLSQSALAKLIYKENPTLFKGSETVRDSIRNHQGNKGKISRNSKKDKSGLKKVRSDYFEAQQSEEVLSKVLILDIETAPLLANIWGIWNQNISTDNIRSDWFMLTWSAKWLFQNKIYSARVTPKEAKSNNDKRIVQSLLNLLNEADIVVTHNGDRFDLPRINTRAIINKLQPPLPYISIDTLKSAKRHFDFTSNKLDYINKVLGLPQKSETNMELWRNCFNGDEGALKKMERYNMNDVKIHEQTYLTMRPFIRPHPNIGLHIIDEHERCPSCGGKELIDTGKIYYTTASSYELFRCKCGSVGRRRKGLKKSKLLTLSVAR